MFNNKFILGIETSCDETSAAVIRGNRVLANVVSSQEIHEQFGGVVPELASRAHIRHIIPIVEKALSDAGIPVKDVSGIAVTYGPGLVGALLVGLNFCKGMSAALGVPFIGINHMEGHIYGNFLSNPEISFPHLSLVVSGGHTMLILMRKHLDYRIIGKTRDDAVGEAFDKGAKMLGLSYPGGPVIDKLAVKGNPEFYRFPRAYLKGQTFDFSYSGLKTAMLVYLKKQSPQYIAEHLSDICSSYQKAAVEVLVKKTVRAAQEHRVRSVGVVGGVAANSLLRDWLAKEIQTIRKAFYLPDFSYCTDNAAMIARAGLEHLNNGEHSPQNLNACPALRLGDKAV
jgi:N6-L-threonylcarbamoyladenine synthase